jgi:diaminopimelate epimerase
MDGGPLTIEWDERSGKVFMTGGAVNVFEGFIKV